MYNFKHKISAINAHTISILLVILCLMSQCGSHLAFNSKRTLRKRVYNGEEISHDEVPFLTKILVKKVIGAEIHKFLIGGVLISDKYVLTSAHGVRNKNVWVTDPNDLEVRIESSTAKSEVKLKVKRVVTHPKYRLDLDPTDIYNRGNDITILEIEKDARVSQVVTDGRVLVNKLNICNTRLKEPKIVTAVGWGRSQSEKGLYNYRLLKKVVIHLDTVRNIVKKIKKKVSFSNLLFYSLARDNRRCGKGDSGGPMYIDTPSERCLLGLVEGSMSFELDFDEPEYTESLLSSDGKYHVDTFTKIRSHMGWISSVTGLEDTYFYRDARYK
ncbi:Ovochymase-2 [Zancudomyces culisetae]|uniref:Ovochymase-2 n=1 Tax=Zancudomyces culisetae TaxID=1213189 RepID=A0A1R1PM40_ZANCU|nr:Ovochymase-2 [Zancudomyces culisetae]|eukprot:OMH81942.1 Ovochymase-2 [Zancudomyces culisetae]